MALRRLAPAVTAALVALCAFAGTASAISNTADPPGHDVTGEVDAIVRVGDTIYLGGSFSAVDGQLRANLAAISAVDGSVTSWDPGTDGQVLALAASGSTVFAGGSFTEVDALPRNGLAAIDAASGSATTWDANPSAGAKVESLAVFGSRLYVGGFNFTQIGGITETNLGAVDVATGAGVGWAANPPNPNFNIGGLAVSPDGSFVYASGFYSTIGGLSRLGIAALDSNTGIVDPDWDPSADGGEVTDVAVAADNSQVYAVGDFFPSPPGQLNWGGQPRAYGASVEPAGGGRTGLATPFAPDLDSQPESISTTPSVTYIAGSFSVVREGHPDQATRDEFAAFDSQTGFVLPWDPKPIGGSGNAVLAGSDGSLFIGGTFTSLFGAAHRGFASYSLPPAADSAPSLSGTPQPGQVLTCANGSWSGSTPQSYAYQFLRDGTPAGVAGATTYTVDAADVGHGMSCRVTATNRAGTTSADSATLVVQSPPVATTAAGPAPPRALAPPVFLRSANVYPVSGEVLVKLPGASEFVPLLEARQIPFGSIVDTKRGRVRICTADAAGKVQCAEFFGGRFKLLQHRAKKPVTELVLVGGSFRGCPKPARRAATSSRLRKSSTVRKLWGDGKGTFRTRGRYASATIRGTRWLTADRCDGTLVRVAKGSVTVRDLVKRKSRVVRARKSYLARP